MEPLYSYANGSMGEPGMSFLSPKNESVCLAAGGTPTSYYNWVQGTWYHKPSTKQMIAQVLAVYLV